MLVKTDLSKPTTHPRTDGGWRCRRRAGCAVDPASRDPVVCEVENTSVSDRAHSSLDLGLDQHKNAPNQRTPCDQGCGPPRPTQPVELEGRVALVRVGKPMAMRIKPRIETASILHIYSMAYGQDLYCTTATCTVRGIENFI